MALPTMTLQQIVLDAQNRCDQVPASGGGSEDFVTTSRWYEWVNGSLYSLYDELITAYGNDYYVADPYEFTTDGTSTTFALPSDFYKLLGVDLVLSGGGAITLKEFAFSERNQGGFGSPRAAGVWGRGTNQMLYRLRGGKLWLRTASNQDIAPASGQTIRLYYVPKLSPLVPIATITLGDEWGTVDDDGAGVVPDAAALTFGAYSLTIGTYNLSTPTAAAVSIAAAITAAFGTSGATAVLSITATASLGVITLTIPSTVRDVAYSSDTEYAVCSTTRILYGVTSSDGISGWLDYVAVDTAIKAATKEESSISDLVKERERIQARIIATAPNRNASGAGRVVDVRGELDDGGGWER